MTITDDSVGLQSYFSAYENQFRFGTVWVRYEYLVRLGLRNDDVAAFSQAKRYLFLNLNKFAI